jgi:hypothetical protein
MAEYSIETCKQLQDKFHSAALDRPLRIERYDPGTELVYDITSVAPASNAKASLLVEKFVGGGFAGQVYKVTLLNIENTGEPIDGLTIGSSYALKILIPPSGLSKIFRDLLYAIGFQGPFQLQTNPAAARSGALWQKFIKTAAEIKFDGQNVVNDVHATFVDQYMGSCGEISNWVDGRTWRLEVDDNLDALKLWKHKKQVPSNLLGSPEYRAKHKFMHDFVDLLHEIGAHEFARQYEWSTCKSQPNCLKLNSTDDDPEKGLMAVDFRAGLTLLPFLPMSPGDIKLILSGIKRGSLVQFDRGDMNKLREHIQKHPSQFEHLKDALVELEHNEDIYRNSVPDITHNRIKLLYSGKLWSTIFSSAVTGWKTKNLLDNDREGKLRNSKLLTFVFMTLGLIPFLGKFLRKLWGRKDWRSHYFNIGSSFAYFLRALKAKAAEKAISWHRTGRLNSQKALKVADSLPVFLSRLSLSILPIALDKFITDPQFRKDRFFNLFIRPVKLYFNKSMREQWLRDMVSQGKQKHLLSDQDADTILSQLDEPYIQKYLVSLVVHLLTLPVTQIVSVLIAFLYWLSHREDPNAWKVGLGIIGFFQIVPISPGSLCRGLYTLSMAIKDKSFKDYNIAVFLSFFKYVGYLAFPIQMAYHYPALARFMAGHWATEAVHTVPVFGEQGALFEHWIFCLFYNWPLTIRKRMTKRAAIRAQRPSRYWHFIPLAVIVAGIFAYIDYLYIKDLGRLPDCNRVWWLSIILLLALGVLGAQLAAGAALSKRIVASAACGTLCACIYTVINMIQAANHQLPVSQCVTAGLWRIFAFTIFAITGTIITELKLPDPELK